MAVFVCRRCEYQDDAPWEGVCPGCGGFYNHKKVGVDREAKRVTAADAQNVTIERDPTGVDKFDYVLSGGLVKKFVVLFGGPKGSGKTTLTMQVLDAYSKRHEAPVLFASAEEYQKFVLANFKRIDAINHRIEVMGCAEFDDVRTALTRCKESRTKVAVFDSLQKLGYDNMPASIQRDIAVAHAINEHCKRSGMSAILLNHMTRALEMAGSTTVGHDVDAELEIHHFNERDDGRARSLFPPETLEEINLKDVRTLLVGKNRGGESGLRSFWLTNSIGLTPLEEKKAEHKKEQGVVTPRTTSLRLISEEETTT
jgi:DNA repair protein RadA/Sms